MKVMNIVAMGCASALIASVAFGAGKPVGEDLPTDINDDLQSYINLHKKLASFLENESGIKRDRLIYKKTCRVGVSTWKCDDDKECDYDNYGCK